MTHPYTHDAAEIRVLKLSGYRQLPLEYMPEKAQYCLQHQLCSWTHENVIKVMQVRSIESKSPCLLSLASPVPRIASLGQSQWVALMLALARRL